MGLGYYFNSYRGQPVVRQGGAVILYHPVRADFNQLHHPSYVDFFEEVLAESTDPAVIEAKFEQQYATDPWYIHLYRTSHAYHGVHPFYMWYWAAHAMDHVGDVVWVGADRKAVERMGFRAASTLADALEMVSRHGRPLAVDHLPAQPAAPDRGRAMSRSARMARVTGTGRRRPAGRAAAWRWRGAARVVPRSAEPSHAGAKRAAVVPDRVGAHAAAGDGAARGRPARRR